MFGMKGFYVSASGTIQGHHSPFVCFIGWSEIYISTKPSGSVGDKQSLKLEHNWIKFSGQFFFCKLIIVIATELIPCLAPIIVLMMIVLVRSQCKEYCAKQK